MTKYNGRAMHSLALYHAYHEADLAYQEGNLPRICYWLCIAEDIETRMLQLGFCPMLSE